MPGLFRFYQLALALVIVRDRFSRENRENGGYELNYYAY